MHRKRLRLVAAVGVAVVALAGCASSTGGSSNNSSKGGFSIGPGVDKATKTITLGVLTPLSGPAALIGKPLTDGQQAYFDWVNAHGGINGWKVKLDVFDSKYVPQTQAQGYSQLEPNVLFFAQSLGSPTTAAIESQASSAGILLGTAAQDSAFVNTPINAVIGTPYAVDMANAMQYLSQVKPGAKLGFIYQDDSYGADGLKGLEAGASAYHVNIVAKATYAVTDTSFTSQVLAMKNAGANVVALTAIPTAAGFIIGTAAAEGYHPQWILQGPAWSEYLMTSTGAASGKPTPIEPAMVGAWVLGYEAAWGDMSVPGMSQFLAAQRQYFPKQVPDGYYMYGYCEALMETKVLAKAIAAKNLTRAGVLTAKLHLGTVNFGGLIPNADYTPSLGPADRETDISEVVLNAPGFLKIIKPYFESSAARSMTFAKSGG
jgi:ABC-type branched-subunit amino acid transport system substrate-binding protein